jgi:hypothetical protein
LGVARKTASAAPQATGGGFAERVPFALSAFSSDSEAIFRAAKVTSCPEPEKELANAAPTLPLPMIPIFILPFV